MRRYLIVFTIIFPLIILWPGAGLADQFNIYRVGEPIIGNNYESTFQPRNFSIWVGVDKNKRKFVFFKIRGGAYEVTTSSRYDEVVKEILGTLIKKAVKWSKIAKENQADNLAVLGCLENDIWVCENGGRVEEKGDLSLIFYSSQNGSQVHLIIKIVDYDNMFYNDSIYLTQLGMEEFQRYFNKIDASFIEAEEKAKKRELFQ